MLKWLFPNFREYPKSGSWKFWKAYSWAVAYTKDGCVSKFDRISMTVGCSRWKQRMRERSAGEVPVVSPCPSCVIAIASLHEPPWRHRRISLCLSVHRLAASASTPSVLPSLSPQTPALRNPQRRDSSRPAFIYYFSLNRRLIVGLI